MLLEDVLTLFLYYYYCSVLQLTLHVDAIDAKTGSRRHAKGKLNLVDLAGSEKWLRAGLEAGEGSRPGTSGASSDDGAEYDTAMAAAAAAGMLRALLFFLVSVMTESFINLINFVI